MAEQLEYAMIVHKAEEGGYWSEVLSLPGAGSQGESIDETVANTKASIEAILDVMKERGEPIIVPDAIVVRVQVAV